MCGYKRTRKCLYKASNPLKYSLNELSQIVVRLSHLGLRYETLALRMFQSLFKICLHSPNRPWTHYDVHTKQILIKDSLSADDN